MGLLGAATSLVRARVDPFLHRDLHPLFQESPFVIYDIGAAGSVFNPFEGPVCDRMRIYGFEPTAASFRALVDKYREATNIEFFQVALCDRDDTVPFYQSIDGWLTHSSLIDHSARGLTSEMIAVEGARLDSVPARYDLPPVDFLKLDTEGSELEILAAAFLISE